MAVSFAAVQSAYRKLRNVKHVREEAGLTEYEQGQIDGAMVALLWVQGSGVEPLAEFLTGERRRQVFRIVQQSLSSGGN